MASKKTGNLNVSGSTFKRYDSTTPETNLHVGIDKTFHTPSSDVKIFGGVDTKTSSDSLQRCVTSGVSGTFGRDSDTSSFITHQNHRGGINVTSTGASHRLNGNHSINGSIGKVHGGGPVLFGAGIGGGSNSHSGQYSYGLNSNYGGNGNYGINLNFGFRM
ncbi:MAG: hypothetical protein CMF62_02580 [Magnetococcales bacterium]|nr:hypothetical protein [Magnetococcales bacterium]|tara:strand:- start:74635 stop:75117 length:483 start_codon:yes stop_codon:yes gene_type:complete